MTTEHRDGSQDVASDGDSLCYLKPMPAGGSGFASVSAWMHGTALVGYAPALTITSSGC